VDDREYHHDQEHERRVEHIQEDFVRDEVTVVACLSRKSQQYFQSRDELNHWLIGLTLSVLDQTEDATDPDQHTAGIQRVNAPLPETLCLHAFACRRTHDPPVPNASDDDKAGEEQDLDNEAADDDVLAQVHCFDRAGGHDAAACALQQERDHVADHENLGEPAGPDQGVLFAVCDLDQAAEAHVDAGGEDGGCDQDENCVDRVDGDGEVGGFICGNGSLGRKC
jgi:hypothetical protein